MAKNGYMLTIRIPLEGIDDPQARMTAQVLLDDFFPEGSAVKKLSVVKLQRVFDNKEPEKVIL